MYKKKKLPKIKFKWPSHERKEQSEQPKHSIKAEEPKITKPKLTASPQIARQKTEEEATLLFKDAVTDLPQSLRSASQQTLRECRGDQAKAALDISTWHWKADN